MELVFKVDSMLSFRSHSRNDIPSRVKWLNNFKAVEFALDNPNKKTDLAEQTKWFDGYEKNPKKIFFTILYDQIPIGFMGLSDIDLSNKSANLFILIGEDDFRGKGLGKKSMEYLINFSFSELKLKQLDLEVSIKNTAAINLYTKLGFFEKSRNEKEIVFRLEMN